MKFKAKKIYGNYKTSYCPFCNRIATRKTKQGLETCHLHSKDHLQEIKCTCGSWLEQKSGQFGPYFNCLNCGNFNFKKGLEIKTATTTDLDSNSNQIRDHSPEINKSKPKISDNGKKEKKEITITSEDVEYFN